MAASMELHGHTSQRSQKRNARKQSKKRYTVLKRNGIYPVDFLTHHLVVANGGLDNNITYSELESIFSVHGEVIDIVMQPQKSYAFISMACKADAERAYAAINSRTLKSPEEVSVSGVTLYLDYVESVPGVSVPSSRLPQGLVLIEDIVNEEEEGALLQAVDWDQEDKHISKGGCLKHRRVKHYGFEFLYGKNNVDRDRPLEHGIPAACHPLISRLCSSGHIQHSPDQLTVNQYEPGQGIPPHVDTHSAFEDGIVSLSLGSQCIMDFRHPDGEHLSVLLPRRSLLIMTGESRYLWTHGITPRKSDIIPRRRSDKPEDGQRLTLYKRATRTSFTLRKIRRKPCNCAYRKQCDSQKSSVQKEKQQQKSIQLPQSEEEAVKIEREHVHEVYEEIAGHFSDTRHTPWPRVAEFLTKQPDGAMVVDIGCGNGKYLGVNKSCLSVGCDRSVNLCLICADRGYPTFVADVLHLPLRSNLADVAISIAVIHHLSTHERRRQAVEEMLRVLKPGGQGLIYVWALEQEKDKIKSNYLKDTRIKRKDCLKSREKQLLLKEKGIVTEPNFDDNDSVPNQSMPSVSDIGSLTAEFGQLNCHDNDSTPAEGNSNMAGSAGLSEGKFSQFTPDSVTLSESSMAGSGPRGSTEALGQSEIRNPQKTDQRLAVHVNRTHFETQDLLVPWHSKPKQKSGDQEDTAGNEEKVVHRFYHVFQQGELEELCQTFDSLEMVENYYDKGNWCVVFRKQ